MEQLDLERTILDFVSRPGYQPVKPRVIARSLQLPADEAAEVKQAIKRLVRAGRLAYGKSHLVLPVDAPQATGRRLIGVFRRAARGYGFVRPLPRGGGARGAGALPEGTEDADSAAADIYIAEKHAGDASDGDIVLVQLRKPRRAAPGEPPRPRGEIVEIVERQTHRFVGSYFEAGPAAYVQVDGSVFAAPIHVGDPGAKGAEPDDKVVIEMVRFPSPWHEGEGVIVEVLGPRGAPGVDTLSIIRQFDLPDAFPDDALEESRREAEQFDEAVQDGRLDLSGETIVTIDPEDARDFDDAISLVRRDDGRWLLGVHIADVAHFVKPDTAMDREARRRGTSVYLPDRVLPMLPEIISNSLASLQPSKPRYAKSVLMELTPNGVRAAVEVRRSVIRSARRLNYEEVDRFLAAPDTFREAWGEPVCDLLARMHELAMTLRRRRKARGAMEIEMPEVKVDLDREGRVAGAHVVRHTESHQIIEEFMLAANEAVAELLSDRGVAFLRRVHADPSPKKLKALSEFVAELGIRPGRLESRFELQKLLDSVVGEPTEHAVHYAVLRSLQRAVYSPEEEGHYALASDCYCHFTSPIRRYPDLLVHRALDAVLDGRRPRDHFDELTVLGEHCSRCEQRAEAAERDLTKLKLLHYFSQRLGEEMEGLITGVQHFGLFVQGIELPAEGLVHADSLADDYYRYDRAAHALVGLRSGASFRLGDRVRVAVARVDLDRRELDFRLIGRAAADAEEDGRRTAPARGPRRRAGRSDRAAGSRSLVDEADKSRRNRPPGGKTGRR